MKLIYNKDKTFADNWHHGLTINENPPERTLPPKDSWINIFGHAVASPLGIPSSSLATGHAIAQLCKFGFDVFTYKTMRSYHFKAHELPNVCYISCNKQITRDDVEKKIYACDLLPNKQEPALAISFGNPSFEPQKMQEDIARAKDALSHGQLLMVSVYGTEQEQRTLSQDYAYTALIAQEAGAQAIECNFSCPNIPDQPPIYKQTDLIYQIIHAVVRVIDIPLCIKIGVCDDYKQLEKLLITAARAGARGVCGLNSIPVRVLNRKHKPYFGSIRTSCGLSGNPIRTLALEFVQHARTIIDKKKLPLTLFATGGITKPEHFNQFLQTGADVVMSATGTMFNPYLAMEWHMMQRNKKYKETQMRNLK